MKLDIDHGIGRDRSSVSLENVKSFEITLDDGKVLSVCTNSNGGVEINQYNPNGDNGINVRPKANNHITLS